MSKRLFVVGLAALTLTAQTIDRTKPPQSPPIPGYKLPPVSETKLANGLTVVLVEDSRFPLATVRLNFQAGSKFDPKDSPGLAEATASLLTEGTKTRSARQISEETDSLGGSLTATAGPDSLTVSGSSLAENLPQAAGAARRRRAERYLSAGRGRTAQAESRRKPARAARGAELPGG